VLGRQVAGPGYAEATTGASQRSSNTSIIVSMVSKWVG